MSDTASMAQHEIRPYLSRVVVGVPDPERTAEFLGEGLDFEIVSDGGTTLAVCAGDYGPSGQGALELRPAEELRVENIVFAVPGGVDLDALARTFDGTRTEDGVQLRDPSGLPVVIEREAGLRLDPPRVSAIRPRRLGHVNAKSPDPWAAVDFYRSVMGMALSERIGEDFFFLRTHTEHHNVGLRRGDVGEIHHLGFEIAGWHAYQPTLDHLDSLGYKAEYGPGKHRPGASYFTYVRDPSSGLRIELFADMAHIMSGHATEPIVWDAGDRFTKTINIWGPLPPESFLR